MGSIEIVIENRFGDSRDMFLRVHSRIEAGVTVELTESAAPEIFFDLPGLVNLFSYHSSKEVLKRVLTGRYRLIYDSAIVAHDHKP